ncbi:SH3 domain-containing protein [Neorhizobium galegae]|uniref:SH3 domain-containing protein n=1 Tax=Neorhizobium galegae TaxID=399 RepID=UPI002104EBF1|nr:SH3 domain-containing protein [Neorhizobium galegae]MCQ1776945.1 SH3 domain-containing protein [Neorhizobium galegae]MCQ1795865.1 SH3 domain-containing protein [Neorhizobium galegae]
MRKRYIAGLLLLPALYFLNHEKKEPTPVSGFASERRLEPRIEPPKNAPERVNLESKTAPNFTTPSSTSSPSSEKSTSPRRMFVRGSSVALRNGPGKNSPILDRYDSGREIETFGVDGEWTRVRDLLTQREGWISSALLSGLKPDTLKKEETKPDHAPPLKILPLLSDSLIIQRLIAGSIANYPGSCPCPESRDRAGRRCGNRSAWARGGGYAPLCYANDITPAMITAFRSQQ